MPPRPNKALINACAMLKRRRISTAPDGLVKLEPMSEENYDPDGLRARSEQAIGELAQALLDSQVLENALAAAFGAREKALEAQQAAMAALNLPSAGEVERLERRVRSLSRRLEEVEDQVDRVGSEIGELRRELKAAAREDPADKK
jgi:chromosome segregation ATPase